MKLETYARTAALFLTVVLLVRLYARNNQVSTGYTFYLLDDPPPPTERCYEGDSRRVVLQMASDGALRINQDGVGENELVPNLTTIFKTRAEKIIFVKADTELSYDIFIYRIGKLKRAIPDLRMVLMTPSWKMAPCSFRVRNGDLLLRYPDAQPRGWWPREIEPPALRSE
jgi:biopolymer transport protein ExbD